MNLLLENVNLSSTSGPNHFAQKLIKYMSLRGVTFNNFLPYDKKLTFIESSWSRKDLDMYLRLDGIYFNAGFDCNRMNSNIKASYEASKGVIFQTEFNRDLIFNWFGEHHNYAIINNGADIINVKQFEADNDFAKKLDTVGNVWSCAASWHSFKRLESNIKYFLEFSNPDDHLFVAGNSPDYTISHPRVTYLGNLNIKELYTLYSVSKYFIHLAYLDHCPNVVIDARAFGCQIICSSSGGTREIAGADAIVISEPQWDFSYIDSKNPPEILFDKIVKNDYNSEISMSKVAKRYYNFLFNHE